MGYEAILEKVKEVILDFFDDDELEITEQTVASDVEGWDSLAHISILASLEDVFGVRFSISDSKEMANVGKIAEVVLRLKNV